eukprot:SAG31_NODE_4616_length_3094_cov_1.782638_4_plen_176_part_00
MAIAPARTIPNASPKNSSRRARSRRKVPRQPALLGSQTIAPDAPDRRDLAAGGLPLLITEYKDGLQGGPGCAYGGKHGDMACRLSICMLLVVAASSSGIDTCAGAAAADAAAFIMHTIPTLTDLDMLSWWTISDIFEEGWLSGIPFYGGYGLLTSQGVAKRTQTSAHEHSVCMHY